MMGTLAAAWEAGVNAESEATALRRGDPEALGALIHRYQNRLYRFLLRMVRQSSTADDLFQQTWLRVAQNIRSYKPHRSFEPWLFTVARNLAIDYLRRSQPLSLEAGGEDSLPLAERLPAAGPSVLENLLARERAERTLATLEQLPLLYREVLVLRFEEEMKLEEIAQVVGAPLSTIKTRLSRGLERMRQQLLGTVAAGDSE